MQPLLDVEQQQQENYGVDPRPDEQEKDKSLEKRVKFAIYLSLGANIILLFAKLGIYIVTLSNSIAASLADSVSIRKGVFVRVCVLCVSFRNAKNGILGR